MSFYPQTLEFIDFVNEDLSRWYIKLVRDRKDKGVFVTLEYVFDRLLRLLAPFAPYVSDYVYKDLIKKNVHFCEWPKLEEKNHKPHLEKQMSLAKEIVSMILSEREN